MIPTILTTALLLASTALIPYQDAYKAQGGVLEPKVIEYTIEEKIEFYGLKYGVLDKMKKIIDCENKPLDPKLQSGYNYPKDYPAWGVKRGDRELSFGLVQIHLPSHPSITIEQAIDPDFSLEFLAKNLSEGRGEMWSCYRKYY